MEKLMRKKNGLLDDSLLGKIVPTLSDYNSNILHPIDRNLKRSEIGISGPSLPFTGYDIWNHYEVSWLNTKGKPEVALAQLIFPVDSPFLIESKSLKLYFNSLNNTKIESWEEVQHLIRSDLEANVKANVSISLTPLSCHPSAFGSLGGYCLDNLDISCNTYSVDPSLLKTENHPVEETLNTHLLRSNCLVTGQPDWGSIEISYSGNQITHKSLLKYIVSFRNHTEFGEHCVERIYQDIMQYCSPNQLTVSGFYTRRGGIDINCLRTNKASFKIINTRLIRQ